MAIITVISTRTSSALSKLQLRQRLKRQGPPLPALSSSATSTSTTIGAPNDASTDAVSSTFTRSQPSPSTSSPGSSKDTGRPAKSAPSSQSAHATHSSSKSLSSGAKVGIGVGVGIAAVLVLVVLLLLYRRRRTKNTQQADARDGIIPEKQRLSRGQSEKGHLLPTWKSELNGEPARSELDAGNEFDSSDDRRRAELSNDRLPTELYAGAFGPIERYQTSEGVQESEPPKDEVRKENEARRDDHEMPQNDRTQQKETPDLSKPPPIPYASKPRPS